MADFSSGDTSPLKGPAPKALPEDISDLDKNEDNMPLTASPGDQAVQFIPGQPINGDAKVEIGDAGGTPAFVGLGKEELMKYANDPFWVKLRWFLFILFWVLWVAMLAGAIIIIVLAPKCAEKKNHPEAYYQLDLKKFAKDGKLADLGNRAKYLSNLGMTSVIISDVLKKSEGSMETEDFKNVDSSFGTLQDFSDAVAKLKSEGLKVLLTFVPNHSGTKHEWFADPEKYEDYYVRLPATEVDSSVWRTVDNSQIEAWTVDPKNQSVKYLQQFHRNADLNFRNKKVVAEITDVLSFWRKKGVDGFLLKDGSYLVEDITKLNESSATKNQPENVKIVQSILNRGSDDPHALIEVHDLNENDTKSYLDSGIIPLNENTATLDKIDQYSPLSFIVDLFKGVHEKENAVLWLSPLQKLKNEEMANFLRLLAFTSNASVISTSGDELDGNSSPDKIDWETASTNGSSFTFLSKLIKVQQELVDDKDQKEFVYLDQPNNVFGFARSKKYITAVNIGSTNVTVDFASLFNSTDTKASVLIATPNAGALKEGEIRTGKVDLPPRSGVTLKVEEPAASA